MLLSLALVAVRAGRGEADVTNFDASAVVLQGSSGPEASTAVDYQGPGVGADGLYVGYRFGLNVSAKDPDFFGDARQDPGIGLFTMSFQVHSSGNYDLSIRARVGGDYQRRDDGIACRGQVTPLVINDPLLYIDDQIQSLTGLRFDGPNLNDIPYGTGGAYADLAAVTQTTKLATISRRGVAAVETYTLTVQVGAVVVSDSCEVSLRMGAHTATPNCDACSYPGVPERLIARDGYFLYVKMDDFPCGDGIVEGDEQCDIGAENGSLSACCNSHCQLRGGDFTCREAAGVCDQPEVCSGSSGLCGADVKVPPSTPCTDDVNPCTDDVCDGSGGCAHVFNTVTCDDGLFCSEPDRCDHGVCSGPARQCPSGTACDETANSCRATAPNLEMTMSAELAPATDGTVIATYTTRITNSGGAARNVQWTSPIPVGTEFFSTLSASKGVPSLEEGPMGFVQWTGDIGAAETVEIRHDVHILAGTPCSQPIENVATITNPRLDASAVIVVGCASLPVGSCPGDCDQDDEVTVDELVGGVNAHLEQASRSCKAADVDGNGTVTTGESMMGIGSALAGCPFSYGRLAGSWLGPLLIADTEPFLQTLEITASGSVERPVPALSASLAPLDRANRIYSLERDGELTGVLQFSADGQHAVYVDEYNGFGALEKGAVQVAASYADSDLGRSFWSGSIARYGPAQRMPGEHEDFSVDEILPFVGLTAQQGFLLSTIPYFIGSSASPLAISQTPARASLGGFEGDWGTVRGEPRSGDAFFWMAPDKNFMAARTCDAPFPQCGVSAWSRLVGSYSERCHDCNPAATTPPILICTCPRDDGHSEITSLLPLPCAGTVENVDGVLSCINDVGEIYVLDTGSEDIVPSIAVYRLDASGNSPPLRFVLGSSTGLGAPVGLAVDVARGEIFVSNGDSVLVFGITARGDVAPLRTLAGPATKLSAAQGLAVDAAHDEIFVANNGGPDGEGTVTVYSRAASGDAPPLRRLVMPSRVHPIVLAIDAGRDEVDVLGAEDVNFTSRIDAFARTADMTATPLRTIAGPSTGLDSGFGIAVDTARGEIFVANNGGNSITAYAAGASGDAVPLRTLAGPATGLAGPTQVALDAATGTIVVSQVDPPAINVYARNASGDKAPLRTIAGPATGLFFPLDIAVVRRPLP